MLDNVEAWTEQVSQVLKTIQAGNWPLNEYRSDCRIFLAGSPIMFPNLKMIRLIEMAGMAIGADDLCSSERVLPGAVYYDEPSEYGLLRALAERYHKACTCPTFADNDRRINTILNTLKAHDIKGIVFQVLKGCHPYDIEGITLERRLKERGYKFIKIETDYVKEDSQNILTRLEAFRETLS